MLAALLLSAHAAMAAPTLPANRDFGVEVARLSPSLRRYLEAPGGVVVWSVVSGSPADLAGFERGDVIVQLDEARAWSPAQVSWYLASARGETVSLMVSRSGVQAAYPVAIPARRSRRSAVASAPPPAPAPTPEVADLQARITELERLLAGAPPSSEAPAR